MSEVAVLLGCGDVGPIHEPMAPYSELVRGTLAEADIRFAQVERVYSERGTLQPHGGGHGRLSPRMASLITDCGFNIVSLAGNHADRLGSGAAARYRRAIARQGHPDHRRRAQPHRGAAACGHRSQRAARGDACLLLGAT
ncbi:MAG: CapA family protein [Alphaproteobacteria bacterium]|nr:CapA family protein [Alphaproteobacteria bacterium]